jgi:hypothetical protein
MRANVPFPEHSFMASCVKLAQTTFFDTLPANSERQPSVESATTATVAVPPSSQRWINRLDNWFHAQAMKDREAYLAQSTDIFDLENRIRRLQSRPYY